MKTLVDTNIILDVLMQREPHFAQSVAFLKLCGAGVTGWITASQTTDIFYLLRRGGKDSEAALGIVKSLTDNLKMIDVTAKDVRAAFDLQMSDFEDALAAQCAKRARMDYIVTRNAKDFVHSPVPAITPGEFLAKHYPAAK